jgi:phosphoribosylglycinamide formyltransferase 2
LSFEKFLRTVKILNLEFELSLKTSVMRELSSLAIGTPLKSSAIKVMMLGAGELGKEVVIELQRYGVEVIAVDRYAHAPAMQVAHRSYTLSMLDGQALRAVIEKENPHYIVPEVEAIATDTLVALESEGFTVIPSANAARLTMNREGIRGLAAEELNLSTSPYRFAGTKAEFIAAVRDIGFPCVVKPIMSSSGKGQSVVKKESDIDPSWLYAQEGGRSGGGRVIVEGFIDFDYEITLLTIRHKHGISFCAPIGHRQEHGDYQESWQPHVMSEPALRQAQDIASRVVNALGGRGIYGVEFFVKGDTVYFSELSPRPHDTGMVTMISQDLSEFALHVRAILGLPIPNINQLGPSASSVILVKGKSENVVFSGLEEAMAEADTQVRLFGKPAVDGERRMGVCLARGASVEEARNKANKAAAAIQYRL